MKNISEKQKKIFISVLVAIIVLISPYLLVRITLKGSNKVTLNYGDDYNELGYSGNFLFKNITKDIKVSKKQMNEIGTYQITYSYQFLFYNIKVKRTIDVKDISGPRISLNGGEVYEIYQNETYTEPGYIAVDNVDGVVTSKVLVTGNVDTTQLGDYEIKYNAIDSNNNETTIIRIVKVVRENPMSMSVENYSLDGWYDDVKLKETTKYDDEYVNQITIVGDANIINMYRNGFLSGPRAWASSSLNAATIITSKVTLYGYATATTLLSASLIYQPQMMILNFGTLSTSELTEEEFTKNANSIIEQLKKQNPDLKLILSSIYPVLKGNDSKFSQKKINRYNFLILELANKHNIKFIDIASALKDSTGYGNPNYFLTDKVHLNYYGHNAVREYIKTHAYVEE